MLGMKMVDAVMVVKFIQWYACTYRSVVFSPRTNNEGIFLEHIAQFGPE
jgi:hypothetical protein